MRNLPALAFIAKLFMMHILLATTKNIYHTQN